MVPAGTPLMSVPAADGELPQTYETTEAFETWFEVGPQDVFPEQFEHFLGMNEGLKRHFMDSHGDLLTPRFWRECQRRAARQAA